MKKIISLFITLFVLSLGVITNEANASIAPIKMTEVVFLKKTAAGEFLATSKEKVLMDKYILSGNPFVTKDVNKLPHVPSYVSVKGNDGKGHIQIVALMKVDVYFKPLLKNQEIVGIKGADGKVREAHVVKDSGVLYIIYPNPQSKNQNTDYIMAKLDDVTKLITAKQ